MTEERRNKLKAEIFGQLPESKLIAQLVDESNYPKLLEMMANIEQEHGKIACQILIKELEIAHPESYKKWVTDVKEAKYKIMLSLAEGKITYKDASQVDRASIGLLRVDYNILVSPYLIESQLRYIAKVFIEDLDYVSVAEFLDHYGEIAGAWDKEDEAIAKLPKSWPMALKIAASFPPLEEFAQQLYHNLPKAEQDSEKMQIIVTNLAKSLIVAAGNLQRNWLKLESI